MCNQCGCLRPENQVGVAAAWAQSRNDRKFELVAKALNAIQAILIKRDSFKNISIQCIVATFEEVLRELK